MPAKKRKSNKLNKSNKSNKSNESNKSKEFITLEYDPFLNIFKVLNNTIFEYYFWLHKTIVIPVDLSPKSDLAILNHGIVKLQVMMQCYLQQQICLSEITSKMLQSVLKPKKSEKMPKGAEIINALKISKEFLNQQGGGKMDSILQFILILNCILFTSANSGSSLENIKTQSTSLEGSDYSKLGHDSDYYKNIHEIANLQPTTSRAISLKGIMEAYDQKEREKSEAAIKYVPAMIAQYIKDTPESAYDLLRKYVKTFNKDAKRISENSENHCVAIMTDAYEKGLFENYKSLTDIELIEKEHDEYKKVVDKQTDTAYTKLYGTIALAATAVWTGDIASVVTAAAETYETATKVEKKEKEKENTKMVASQLFEYSTILCSNTFWFNLDFNNNEISLVGDRISYKSILELFYILEENIAFFKNSDDLFKSLEQKLKMLEHIIKNLEKNVNYNTFLQLDKRIRSDSDAISDVTDLFNKQLKELEDSIHFMKHDFPIDEKQLIMTSKRNEEVRVLTEKRNKESNIKKQFEIDQQINDAIVAGNIFKTWAKVQIVDRLKMYGDVGMSTIFSLPRSLAASFAKETMGTLNDVLLEIVTSPAGITMMCAAFIGLLFGAYYHYKMIKFGKDSICYVISFPFIFVYKLSKGVYGYVFKHVGTVYDPNSNFIESKPESKRKTSIEESDLPIEIRSHRNIPPPPRLDIPPPPKGFMVPKQDSLLTEVKKKGGTRKRGKCTKRIAKRITKRL